MNATEVLEARATSRTFREQIADSIGLPDCYEWHSPSWWDMMWKKHEAWREGNYPAAAGTGWEVTPPTGVEISSS